MLRIVWCPETFTPVLSAPTIARCHRKFSITMPRRGGRGDLGSQWILEANRRRPRGPHSNPARGSHEVKPRTACRLSPNMHKKTTRTHSPPEIPKAQQRLRSNRPHHDLEQPQRPHKINRNGQYIARDNPAAAVPAHVASQKQRTDANQQQRSNQRSAPRSRVPPANAASFKIPNKISKCRPGAVDPVKVRLIHAPCRIPSATIIRGPRIASTKPRYWPAVLGMGGMGGMITWVHCCLPSCE